MTNKEALGILEGLEALFNLAKSTNVLIMKATVIALEKYNSSTATLAYQKMTQAFAQGEAKTKVFSYADALKIYSEYYQETLIEQRKEANKQTIKVSYTYTSEPTCSYLRDLRPGSLFQLYSELRHYNHIQLNNEGFIKLFDRIKNDLKELLQRDKENYKTVEKTYFNAINNPYTERRIEVNMKKIAEKLQPIIDQKTASEKGDH